MQWKYNLYWLFRRCLWKNKNNELSLSLHSSLLLNEITKLMPAIDELSVSIYLSLPRTKTNLIRAQTGFGGIF